ncbi:hypothetical protein DFQ30_000640 [Apophysomyces sp. BC1015]|nr:hypothetical protein DFQ30_000640 [Apophysomyces sp. BC1015]
MVSQHHISKKQIVYITVPHYLGTKIFDRFTARDYEQHMTLSNDQDDNDPVAWFRVSNNKQVVVELNDRSGKYILIKLLRAEHDSENIDLQYVGIIGYAGARAFPKARLH